MDVTNALTTDYQLALGYSTSGAEELQKQAPKAHVVGEGVLVASNGDRLVIDFDALADLPDAGTGEIHPRGTYTIARGTGRFVGATGNGSLVVDGIVGQTETAVLDGTIRVGDAE